MLSARQLRSLVRRVHSSGCCPFSADGLRDVASPIVGRRPRILPDCQAEHAFDGIVKSGQHIFLHGVAATPTPLLEALYRHTKQADLRDISLHHGLLLGKATWNDGPRRADYVPIFLSEIPQLFYTRTIPVDVAIIQMSLPDENGLCSLGPTVEIARPAVRCSKQVIALQNPRLPRTLGESFIHDSHIDVIVEADDHFEIHERKIITPGEIEQKIFELIAENLIENGSTLQLGVGDIPDAVLAALANHRDLGIHSEMVSDGVLDLVEKNVINNRLKTTFPGRIVAAFIYGTRRLYDFVDNNSQVHMGSTDWVNDPSFIRQQHRMVGINSAIEIDITGHVVSDSVGSRFFSGFGGQVDFIRGSAIADQGKAIIAMPSINKKTGESKISAYIKQGAGVVTSRGHVRYVVTEHGIAHLWGKNVRQRAHSLINIAHPQHREQLEKDAFQRLKGRQNNPFLNWRPFASLKYTVHQTIVDLFQVMPSGD